jgi:hypothetical protein
MNSKAAPTRAGLIGSILLSQLIGLGLSITTIILPATPVAAQPDPLAQILKSKTLNKNSPSSGVRSKLNYPLRPWFKPNSNQEKLFSQPGFAPILMSWSMPVGRDYKYEEPRVSFAKTHIKVDALTEEVQGKKFFQITILVPHPAFKTAIEGKLVPDFADREPPSLLATGSTEIDSQGVSGTLYLLKSERCSALFKLADNVWVEARSIDSCGTYTGIKELTAALELEHLQQRLQS